MPSAQVSNSFAPNKAKSWMLCSTTKDALGPHCAMCAPSIHTSGLSVYKPAMISLSLGSRLTVQGRNISTSRAARTGILDERKTSKLRTSPSISSNGSTSLVVGMFLDILHSENKERNFFFFFLTIGEIK